MNEINVLKIVQYRTVMYLTKVSPKASKAKHLQSNTDNLRKLEFTEKKKNPEVRVRQNGFPMGFLQQTEH